MAKFLIKASYTLDGVRGLVKEGGSGRRASAKTAIEGLGGKLEAFYFAFGDNVSAAALALRVNQAGAVQIQTVVLLTPEEVDKAVKTGVDYRPPGS